MKMRHEQNKQGENIDMNFEVFVEIYLEEVRTKIKLKSFVNKKRIMEKHILPYFEGKNMREITPEEIEKWQNKMAETIDPKTGRAYTKSYIKTMHGHMRAIMNYYKFSESPSEPEATGEKWIMAWDDELEIWKPDRYMRFAEAMMEKPLFFYVFEILYWCGLRDGEILALAPDDIDFEKKEISISKTFQSLNEKEYIMSCKSMGNKRTVSMPDFVCNEMKDYMDYIYKGCLYLLHLSSNHLLLLRPLNCVLNCPVLQVIIKLSEQKERIGALQCIFVHKEKGQVYNAQQAEGIEKLKELL